MNGFSDFPPQQALQESETTYRCPHAIRLRLRKARIPPDTFMAPRKYPERCIDGNRRPEPRGIVGAPSTRATKTRGSPVAPASTAIPAQFMC